MVDDEASAVADDEPSSAMADGGAPSASVLQDPAALADADLEDWGVVDEPIEGESRTAGTVIHKGPDGRSESGVWTCTPGTWACEVDRDEFCYFLEGRATYTHEDGTVIDIEPGTTVLFPAGWTGTCRIEETVRKVYMIR
ncbi:cupin domain-containing protein [Halopenitus persicus]|uniref:(S)-ureidoglycine aminohydrolase cupin domain-containing protein n=1 Tax=Halopenitus persicus TaxID=1048396 RepID=A0A1H3HAS9_9EURY|nr:cupin domain-containing protein [Halopenitus persicus]SDY12703.1 hypothetical protein SAMN05216564_103202 [Halopenitus persicus]